MAVLRSRVSELARERGYKTDQEVARQMGISDSLYSYVKRNERGAGPSYIAGALKFFPDKTFDDLFYVEEETNAVKEPAEAVNV